MSVSAPLRIGWTVSSQRWFLPPARRRVFRIWPPSTSNRRSRIVRQLSPLGEWLNSRCILKRVLPSCVAGVCENSAVMGSPPMTASSACVSGSPPASPGVTVSVHTGCAPLVLTLAPVTVPPLASKMDVPSRVAESPVGVPLNLTSTVNGVCPSWRSGTFWKRVSAATLRPMLVGELWISAIPTVTDAPSRPTSVRSRTCSDSQVNVVTTPPDSIIAPDYAQSSARSGGLAKVAVFLGSRASLPADAARSAAFASWKRALPRGISTTPGSCGIRLRLVRNQDTACAARSLEGSGQWRVKSKRIQFVIYLQRAFVWKSEAGRFR